MRWASRSPDRPPVPKTDRRPKINAMADPKHRPNPLKLNPLQQRTLAILQQMARTPGLGRDLGDGRIAIAGDALHAHGDHFHVGDAVILGRDATGLDNPAVHVALERRGLVELHAAGMVLTIAGGLYDTGVAELVLHRSDH